MRQISPLRGLAFLVFLGLFSNLGLSESQGSDYKGIVDPFGDPTAYEFAEDEKVDKEFFHLGRFLMLGMDLGLGSFTSDLGADNEAAFYAGAHLVYFFDKSLGFEARGAYIQHSDFGFGGEPVNNTLIPINVGFRFYPDIKSAPRPIALANPYVAFGGGLYIRKISDISGFEEDSSNHFGGYLGGGIEFLIYRRHVYLGADFRYHFVNFDDPDRDGHYISSVLTITYNY